MAETNSRLSVSHVSVGQCLKFRYDTPSFSVVYTLNNLQDLDPEYSAATAVIDYSLVHVAC